MPYKDPKTQKEYDRKRYLGNRGEISTRFQNDKNFRERKLQCGREYYYKKKLEALQIISGLKIPRCIYCDCSDLRILEINHKNLGGSKDYKFDKNGEKYKRHASSSCLYYRVARRERKPDDLEVACKVCNAKHYVEKKFGLYFEVIFRGEKNGS